MNYTAPNSINSERIVLSSLMGYGLSVLEACHRLREEMFYTESHRTIFSALMEMITDGKIPDEFSLMEHIGNTKMASIGGFVFLSELNDGMNRVKDPSQHVEIIIEKWKLRTGMRICERYSGQFAQEESSDATLSLMQAEVFDAMQELSARDEPLVSAYTVSILDETLDYSTSPMGMTYGHAALDTFTMGMQEGEVTVIGARSGVGKSSMMCKAAYDNASAGIPVDLFSLEMDRKPVMWRLWSIESGLPFGSIKRKTLNEDERRHLRRSALRVAEMPLRIHRNSEMTLGQIAAMARLSARRNGMKMFAVDYAQIVNVPEAKDEKTKVSMVSRTLTKLAKSEGVHLMLLSQLRKVPSEMYNKAPNVGDLRETSQLENDAHTIVLLHRGWDEEASRISHDGEMIIPKQRSGGNGALQTQFNPKSLTFE